MSDYQHATDALRALDPDRYAASLIVPPTHRADVQALFAFSAEIAAIRERVSEPGPGEIRLQWWVDALEGKGHGAVAQNPIAGALLEALDRHQLPRGPLVRLLAARRFDLYGDPMTDVGQFEGYAGETVSILYQYGAMILESGSAEQAADAAGHLGVAQALVGHVRAFGYNAARGQIFLPLSIFAANGARESDIFSGQESEAISGAIGQVLDLARDHADKARAAIATLPRAVRPVFGSITLVQRDIKAFARLDGKVFTPRKIPSPFSRLAALVLWGLRNG